MMRPLRVVSLLALSIALFYGSGVRAQAKPVAEGTGRAGEFPTKWALYLPPDIAPGEEVVLVEGTIGTDTIKKHRLVVFYFAGIEGRTLHLYRIESDEGVERSRRPIILPLAADNTAVLRVRPLFADRSYTVRLRLGTDNLLAGALVK